MPILLDGNNLLHSLPKTQRSRPEVRKQVLDATRHEAMSVTVVFDGPPPSGSPTRESLGRVTVIYSGNRTADDVIVGSVPVGRGASQWTVVTDDRGLTDRVREKGARVRRLAEWRRRPRPKSRRVPPESKLSSRDVADWEAFFSRGGEYDDVD
jgi:predicted RNA-binding protein with PIN domain